MRSRWSFAARLVEDRFLSAAPDTKQAGGVQAVKELPGHEDVKTTMVYIHAQSRDGIPSVAGCTGTFGFRWQCRGGNDKSERGRGKQLALLHPALAP